jgi:hypothetical protein
MITSYDCYFLLQFNSDINSIIPLIDQYFINDVKVFFSFPTFYQKILSKRTHSLHENEKKVLFAFI